MNFSSARFDRAPVVMIGYVRSETLERSLTNLAACYDVEKHDLYLFLDAPYRKEDENASRKMHALAYSFQERGLPHLKVILRKENFGVPANHISAMNEVLEQYGRAIFFEDDVLVSRTFLRVLNQALDFYKDDQRIFCINGWKHPKVSVPRTYNHDVYLAPRNSAWGFATWKDRWEKVDFSLKSWPKMKTDRNLKRRLSAAGRDILFMADGVYDGRLKTWDVQCFVHMVREGLFAVEPIYSLSKNIGFSSGALHTGIDNPLYSHMKYYDFEPSMEHNLLPDGRLIRQFPHLLYGRNCFVRAFRKLERALLAISKSNDEPIAYTLRFLTND